MIITEHLIKELSLIGFEITVFKKLTEIYSTVGVNELVVLAKEKTALILTHFKTEYGSISMPRIVKDEVLSNLDVSNKIVLDIIDYFTDLQYQINVFKKLNPIPLEYHIEKMSPDARKKLDWRDNYFKELGKTGKTEFNCDNPSCIKTNLLPFTNIRADQATLDHIIPCSFDIELYSFDLNNVQVLCNNCNNRKGNIEINYLLHSKQHLISVYGEQLINDSWKDILKLMSKFLNKKIINSEPVIKVELVYINNTFKVLRTTKTTTEICDT